MFKYRENSREALASNRRESMFLYNHLGKEGLVFLWYPIYLELSKADFTGKELRHRAK